MILRYIPLIAKKDPADILAETVHSAFFHSFPPFIEKGRLTCFGLLFVVGLAISCATGFFRCFLRND